MHLSNRSSANVNTCFRDLSCKFGFDDMTMFVQTVVFGQRNSKKINTWCLALQAGMLSCVEGSYEHHRRHSHPSQHVTAWQGRRVSYRREYDLAHKIIILRVRAARDTQRVPCTCRCIYHIDADVATRKDAAHVLHVSTVLVIFSSWLLREGGFKAEKVVVCGLSAPSLPPAFPPSQLVGYLWLPWDAVH